MGSAPPTGHYSVKLVDNIEAPQPFFPEGFNPIGPVPRVDSKLLCESQIQVLARNLANEIAAHNLSRSHANHLLALLMTLERDLLKQEATINLLGQIQLNGFDNTLAIRRFTLLPPDFLTSPAQNNKTRYHFKLVSIPKFLPHFFSYIQSDYTSYSFQCPFQPIYDRFDREAEHSVIRVKNKHSWLAVQNDLI